MSGTKENPGLASRMQPACWNYCCIVAAIAAVLGVSIAAFAYSRAKIFVLLVAFVPTFVVFTVLWFLHKDHVRFPLIIEMFWLGLVGAIPCALIEAGIAWLTVRHWEKSNDIGVLFAVATLNAFIIAALCEESFKYLCLSRVVEREELESIWHRKPTKAYGTVLCGCAAALGFATIENFLYVYADLAIQTAVLRAVLAVPGHCAGGVIIAIGLTEKVFYGKETNFFWIILPSVLFHGFYDWFLMASAIGYKDGRKTGDALALGGLVCAMLTDVCQFLYMFRRLNILEESEVGYTKVKVDETYE